MPPRTTEDYDREDLDSSDELGQRERDLEDEREAAQEAEADSIRNGDYDGW